MVDTNVCKLKVQIPGQPSVEHRKGKKEPLIVENFVVMLAYFNGIFPVKNLLSRRCSSLDFKWMSWPTAYSIFMFLVKLILLYSTVVAIYQFNESQAYRDEFIDLAVGAVSGLLTFCAGILVHITCVISRKGVFEIYNRIENYDSKYGWDVRKRGVTLKVMVNNGVSLYLVFAPCLLLWNVMTTGKKPLVFGISCIHPDFYTDNPILVGIFMVFSLAVVEFAVMYLNGELFVINGIMEHRITALREKVDEISRVVELEPLKENLPIFVVKEKPNLRLLAQRWVQFGRQYLDMHDLFKMYEGEVGCYFILLLLMLTLATVCMIFYFMNSQSPLARDVPLILTSAILFSAYRIYALADCGEDTLKEYQKLVGSMLMVNQKVKVKVSTGERYQFKRALTLVQTLPILMSAKGFFNVNRGCVTSILSMIITYTVVLLQFRLSDKPVANQQGAPINLTENMKF